MKVKTQLKKGFFKNNLGLLFSAREKVSNNFKSRLFQKTTTITKIR